MRLDVRLQRQIAELHFHDPRQSSRQIAGIVRCSHNSVSLVRRKILDSGRAWQDLSCLDDDELVLAIGSAPAAGVRAKVRPDWLYIRSQLEIRDANLHVLWIEFRESTVNGIGYSLFTQEFRAFEKSVSTSMRIARRAGEKLYCDFTGKKVPITNRDTGEIRYANVFVSTMGASSKMYAEATWTQSEEDWIRCHVNAFEFYGGVPVWTVPDNLKAAVIKRSKLSIEINAAYNDCLRHYKVAAQPARPRKGNDKGSVEAGVRLLQTWVLFPWRTRVFFSIEEVNEELLKCVDYLNNKPIRRLGGSRQSRFEAIDAPALRPLPALPYEMCTWRYNVMVGPDYRVEHERSFYMVPYALVGHRVDLRITKKSLDINHKTLRVATYPIAAESGSDAIDRSFMPVNHRRVLEGEPKELVEWSTAVGPGTAEVMKFHLCDRKDPTNGLRAAQRVRHLANLHGTVRIEAACAYTAKHQMFALRHLEAVLKSGVDELVASPCESQRSPQVAKAHENNRDPSYFDEEQDVQS